MVHDEAMTLIADRIAETTITTGTGTLTLAGAITGFRTFVAGIGNGNIASYVIIDGVEWETGIGTVSSGTLSRDTVLASSNGGAKVNWTNSNAASRTVICMLLAAHAHPINARGDFLRGSANGVVERLQLGSNGQILQSNGNDLIFAIKAVAIPPGTKMLFQQTAAPAGWSKDASHNNKGLRVVTGAVSSGGATPFDSIFSSGLTTGSFTLTTAEIPAHSHNIQTVGLGGSGNDLIIHEDNTGLSSQSTDSTGGGGAHSHNLPWDLQYVDIIFATKDQTDPLTLGDSNHTVRVDTVTFGGGQTLSPQDSNHAHTSEDANPLEHVLIVGDSNHTVQVAAGAAVEEFYVSEAGNDSNLGSQSSPWLTSNKVNGKTFNGGASIFFNRGDSFKKLDPANSGFSGKAITFGAYGSGPRPILSGGVSVLGVTGNWTSISGNRWTRSYSPTDSGAPALLYIDFGLGGEDIQNAQSSQAAVNATGEWFHSGSTLTVYNVSGNPASQYTTLEINDRERALNATGLSYLAFDHLDFRKGRYGMRIDNADNLTYTSCISHWNGKAAYRYEGTTHTVNMNDCDGVDNGVFDPLLPSGGGQHGIHLLDTATGIVATGGNYSRNAEDGLTTSTSGAGVVLTATFVLCEDNFENPVDAKLGDMLLEDSNFISHISTGVIGMTIHGAKPVTVTSNRCFYKGGGDTAFETGVRVDDGGKFISTRDVIEGSDEGSSAFWIEPTASGGACIFKSTLFISHGSRSTVRIQADTGHDFKQTTMRSKGSAKAFEMDGTATASVKNSILDANGNFAMDIGSSASVTVDGNLYERDGTTNFIDDGGVIYDEADVTTFDPNGVAGDPLYLDEAGGDYTPSSAGPAAGAGVTGLGVTTDLEGATFPTPPDIGCLIVNVQTLTVNDANHTQQVAATTMTGPQTLAVDDSNHTQQVEGLAVFGPQTLVVSDSNHTQQVAAAGFFGVNNIVTGSGTGGTFTASGYVPTPGSTKLTVGANIEQGGGGSIVSVSYAGNPLTQRVSAVEGANLSDIWDLDDPLDLAASGDVVVTYSGGNDGHFVASILGTKSGAPHKTSVRENASSSESVGSITPTVDNTLLISFISMGGNVAITPSSPMTESVADFADGGNRWGMAEQVKAVAGVLSPTWTWDSSLQRNAQAMIIYEAK